MTNTERIIAISKRLGLTHIGSNLSCLPILEAIYAEKKPEDIVILDNAHAHLAHLVVEADYDDFEPDCDCEVDFIIDPESLIEKYGIHCDRKAGCDASGGSLGHGIGIGIGYALTDPTRDVYVIVSDGSMMEGSNWEALRIAGQLTLTNLKIHLNANGYSALAPVDTRNLKRRMRAFFQPIVVHNTSNGEGFEGLPGHYKKL